MKDTTFKMTGFPQHAGVSPVKDEVKIGTNIKSSVPSKFNTPPTKIQEFLAKHPKLDKNLKTVKKVATKVWDKANEFAKTDAGKAVIAGVTEKATAPRPKKEIVAIINGEQKSIM